MQPNEFGRGPVEVKDTWNQERDSDRLQDFVARRLARPALADVMLDDELLQAA